MRKITTRSPAKINLTFEILGKMPDGYHQVVTLLQAIDLEDELSFEFAPGSDVQVEIGLDGGSQGHGFPLDKNNLIVRAVHLFLDAMTARPGFKLKVSVNKNIPIGAGLAGGSGNAAAALLAMNHYLDYPLRSEELLTLAAKLGADVPFCISGGTAIGHGRGDDLKAVESAMQLNLCIIKPRKLSIATPWVYQKYDELVENGFDFMVPDLESSIIGLQNVNLEVSAKSFGNVFEAVVFHHYPELAVLKQKVMELGCLCCHLSGSGPALYAVASDSQKAYAMKAHLDKIDAIDAFVSTSVKHGARLIGE